MTLADIKKSTEPYKNTMSGSSGENAAANTINDLKNRYRGSLAADYSFGAQQLADEKAKLQMIGSFSLGVVEKQQRINALGLKTGVIEVGAASQMSQGYLKDSVDDAVKAAASAFNNGVVLGCNCSLIDSIKNLIDKQPASKDGIVSDENKLY